MKITFISILLLSCFTAYMPIKSSKVLSINSNIKSLVSDGYSKHWAIKKALVESNVIAADKEYYSIIND